MDLHAELLKYVDKDKAAFFPRFFKTGPGQYGEGDKFLGVTVPNIRKVAKLGKTVPLEEVEKLLKSVWHEDRLLAVLILVQRFEKGDELVRYGIYEMYLVSTKYINNWDIVDSSARQIVGGFLYRYPKRYHFSEVLTKLAASQSMWERRIAMIATSYWLYQGEVGPTAQIAEVLLDDPEDLMHKAVGWMLREMGKRVSPDVLRRFLEKHAATMPRTALRYAIEHFDQPERKMWLAKR